jgi:hypothetical protein
VPDESIDIRVRLRDARQFKTDTSSTAGQISRIGKTAEKSNNQVRRSSRLGVGALKGLAGAAVATGVAFLSIGAAKSAIDTTAKLAKTTIALHKNLGLTNEVASQWAALALSRGVDTSTLSTSFTNLSKNVEAAGGGSKRAIAMFRELGISQDELTKGSHNFQFLILRIADGLAKLPPGTRKAAIAQKLLGRSSQTTLPIFTQGRKALQENLDLAKAYGVTLSGNPIKQQKRLARAQKEMEFAQLGWQVTFATKIAPALTKFILLITRGSAWLSKHKTLTSFLIPTVIAFAAALWLVNIAMSANPIVIAVAALVALGVAVVVAYKKFTVFRNVVNATFDWIKGHWPLLLGILTGPIGGSVILIIRYFGQIKAAFKAVINWIIRGWNALRFTVPSVDTHIPGVGKVGGFTIGVPQVPLLGSSAPAATGGRQRGPGRAPEIQGGITGGKKVKTFAADEGGGVIGAILELAKRPVIVQIDKREIARAYVDHTLGAKARA